eukprot:354058_1
MSTKFTYFIHVLAIILTITTRSVVSEPTAPLLYLEEFPKKAICNNLLSASKRINDISLTKCIEYCENLSLEECKMINYFNFWKTDVDSRCYIFNELCSMSKNLENSINSSQIWYKNQFTQEYCVDYRNYLDNVGDSCNHYTDYQWCNNNQIIDSKNIEEFEQLKSEFSAIDACCDCGGGKLAVDSISISYINDINNNLLECSFKEEQHNLAAFGLTNIRKWNNFAAFDLSQYINQHLPSTTEEYFNSDLLIYNEFKLDTILNNYSSITMCDFQNYVYQNSINTTNDFFIMMTINYDNTFQLFLNSEFFDFNQHILYQTVEVSHYKYCLQQIETYNKNNAHINGILPCWNQYTHPTPLPTYQSTQIHETVKTKPSEFPVYAYIIIGLCVPICIVAAILANNRINGIMTPNDKGAESEIIELETHKYSDDHFAIHPLKKNIIPTSTSFLISSSNILNDEKEPMLMNEENKEQTCLIEPGSEGYLEEVIIEMRSNKKHKQHKKHAGKLVCQKQYYDEKQMKYINYEYSKTINGGEFAYILFGDNDMDRQRSNKRNRTHFGGQARILGKYDRRFGYGIITTFMKQTPNLERFKSVIDALFVPLQNHLSCGYDVVYTYPSERDLRTHRNRYYFHGKQIIYHNIGTGIAFLSLTIHHIEYIQFKLKELEKFASDKIIVDYYFMNPTKNKNLTVYNTIQNNNEIMDEKKEEKYDIAMIDVCPSCGLNKHYLMKFMNCNHRMCEECLRGYICYDMQYDQENDRDRFKCYAHILNKCNGYLCIDDIKYPINRCKCDECLKNNTDSGNGTILSDENYNKFKNILASFDVKLKIWNKDICPNNKCRKPFVVQKPFEMVENKICQQSMEIITNDIRKEFDHCNCCGKYRNNHVVYGVDEIKINNNICMVCNFWNCDECRNNCFYKVDTNFTQQPTKQILDAFVGYNQNKMKYDNDIYSLDNEFNICEMCWYNYYCHICPHCNYIFCGKCDIKWEGNTINWFDINVSKYDGIIKKNHNKLHKHKCIKQKEKLQKQEKHKSYIRINEHREKLEKLNLENQKKSQCIFEKEAENFKLKQKIENMEQKMVDLKIENQQKENMILSKHLSITAKEKEQVEEKLRESKYMIVWQWFDNNNIWNAFNKRDINNIENLKIGQTYKLSLTGNKQKYTIYKLSKDTGEQINCKTNFKRKLRKIKIEKHMNGIIYPDFWQYYICDKEQKEGYYMTPGNGNGGIDNDNDNDYTTPKLIELNLKTNKIAQRVSNEFYATAKAKTNKIIKIESVQNRYLWDKYYTQKESMKKSNGLNKLNERSLWHGTHITVMDKIIKQGFRKEFNTTHQYGEGTYFAVNADYSLSYCKSDNNTYKMFQCLVLCGESAVGSKKITLRNWPNKSGSGQIVDSLVNSRKHPAIFVIHDDVRVYPMFIVHYTRS